MTLAKQNATMDGFANASFALAKRWGRGKSNLFLSAEMLENMLANSPCIQYEDRSSVFLCAPMNDDYIRLYYQAPDCTALDEGLSALRENLAVRREWDRPLVCDIVGTDEEASEIAAIFQKCGFILYKKLRQLNIINARVLRHFRGSRAEYATSGDTEELYQLLRDNFDVLSDQIPRHDELSDRIGRREVIVVRQDGKIIAFQVFSLSGHTYHGMFSFVRKEYRTGFAYFEINSFLRDIFDKHRVAKAVQWRDEARLGTEFSTVSVGEIPLNRVDYIFVKPV